MTQHDVLFLRFLIAGVQLVQHTLTSPHCPVLHLGTVRRGQLFNLLFKLFRFWISVIIESKTKQIIVLLFKIFSASLYLTNLLQSVSTFSAMCPSSAAALLPHFVTNLFAACSPSVVTRATEEPSGANGHHFRQASEGGRPCPRSWTLYRYTHALLMIDSYLTSERRLMPSFLHVCIGGNSVSCKLPG